MGLCHYHNAFHKHSAGQDFIFTQETLTISTDEPGFSLLEECIDVPLLDDGEEEGAEFFLLALSTSNLVPILNSVAVGLIMDNDFSGTKIY